MKKVVFAIALLCLLAVQGYSQLTVTPMQEIGYEYFAFTCLTLDGGGNCAPNQVIIPVPGVFVTLFVTPRTGTGDHSHETTQTQRPSVEFITNARLQTAADGKVHWKFYGNNLAGTYDVLMVPEDSGGHHFPTLTTTYIAEVTTTSKSGAKQYFVPFIPGTYGSGAPTDIKHRTETGQTGISTYGTRACVQRLQTATRRYYLSFFNPARYKNAFWRGSIRKGGEADNEIDLNGTYLFTNPGQEWFVRLGEMHVGGRGFDFVNPKLYEPNEARKAIILATWEGLMYRSGFRYNLRNPYGDFLGGQEAARGWWVNQNMIHLVCLDDAITTP